LSLHIVDVCAHGPQRDHKRVKDAIELLVKNAVTERLCDSLALRVPRREIGFLHEFALEVRLSPHAIKANILYRHRLIGHG
jgi:hypothetical protein